MQCQGNPDVEPSTCLADYLLRKYREHMFFESMHCLSFDDHQQTTCTTTDDRRRPPPSLWHQQEEKERQRKSKIKKKRATITQEEEPTSPQLNNKEEQKEEEKQDEDSNTVKICMMMTRLACNQAIESLYWRMDNNSDVGLLTGYVLYLLPIELESMDLDSFSH